MKVGVTLFGQNYRDWDRFERRAVDEPMPEPDQLAYDNDMAIGNLTEGLGFDSLWTVEHHFSPYTMVPDPLQLLTYFAGRTERIELGTMVIVLPWHDPVQTAEKISMLDNMLQGRRLHLGFGRGAGQREFDGLRIPMGESRARFNEALEVVRRALTQERFAYEGEYYTVPETTIRPRPRSADLLDRMYCAWGSPQTLPIAANAGLRMLFIPQKSWEEYAQDVEQYNAIRAEHGLGPDKPAVVAWVYCDEDESAAWEGAKRYMGEYWNSANWHYQFYDPDHFRRATGYEHYADLMKMREGLSDDQINEGFAGSQVWGTPAMCVEKLKQIQDITSAEQFIAVFNYGGMDLATAERNMRLFAAEVLPAIQAYEPGAVAAGD